MVFLIGVIFFIALLLALRFRTFCPECGHAYPADHCPIHQSRIKPHNP
jgi:hypothetical protein